MQRIRQFSLVLLALGCGLPVGAQPAPYNKAMGVQGTLRIAGSEGHQDLARIWAEKFRSIYPSVVVQVEGGGSQAATAAVKEGRADFGILARELNAAEKELLGERLSRCAVVHVATDILTFFVSKENSLPGLTLQQLERIYAASPRSGSPIRSWSDVASPLGAKPIVVLGRNTGSGSYTMVRNLVLGGGNFRSDVRESVGPASVVQGVAAEPTAIGYTQFRFRSNRVRALSLGPEADRLVEPSLASAQAGTYPLVDEVYFLVDTSAERDVQLMRTEFVRFVLSREGQELAESLLMVPIRPSSIAAELAKLK